MSSSPNTYRNVRIVAPDDPEYVAFMRRMADMRPGRGGPRAAGEYLGGIIETCVRHWLSGHVPLQLERILSWEQRQRTGRFTTLYREVDGIWPIDAESLCLYEMKLTTAVNQERGVGLRQLDASSAILFASGRYRYVLKRLVYIGEEAVPVLEDIPVLEPEDEYEELGVIWVAPASVEEAAKEIGLDLQVNWLADESREGFMEDPERDEWRQYSDTVDKAAGEEDEEANPLAAALRRALNKD